MTTPRAVATELDQLFDYLTVAGVIYFWNPIDQATPHRVSWHSPNGVPFLSSHADLSVSDYLYWLKNGMYSAVLFDGSLLQITYLFDGREVIGHRLAYVPCPVALQPELMTGDLALEDAIELQLAVAESVLMKSVIRFDYDPLNAREDHPKTHLTLNSIDCRIACVSPLRVGRFVDFVFRNFYPAIHREHPYLRSMSVSGWFGRSISEMDAGGLHVSWPS